MPDLLVWFALGCIALRLGKRNTVTEGMCLGVGIACFLCWLVVLIGILT